MTSAAASAPVEPVAFEPEWNTADRFRKVRRDVLRLSQEELADRLGVSRKAYASWEMGRTTPRDVVAVTRRLAMLSGVSQAWLLGIPAGSTYVQVSASSESNRAIAEDISTYRRKSLATRHLRAVASESNSSARSAAHVAVGDAA